MCEQGGVWVDAERQAAGAGGARAVAGGLHRTSFTAHGAHRAGFEMVRSILENRHVVPSVVHQKSSRTFCPQAPTGPQMLRQIPECCSIPRILALWFYIANWCQVHLSAYDVKAWSALCSSREGHHLEAAVSCACLAEQAHAGLFPNSVSQQAWTIANQSSMAIVGLRSEALIKEKPPQGCCSSYGAWSLHTLA